MYIYTSLLNFKPVKLGVIRNYEKETHIKIEVQHTYLQAHANLHTKEKDQITAAVYKAPIHEALLITIIHKSL